MDFETIYWVETKRCGADAVCIGLIVLQICDASAVKSLMNNERLWGPAEEFCYSKNLILGMKTKLILSLIK